MNINYAQHVVLSTVRDMHPEAGWAMTGTDLVISYTADRKIRTEVVTIIVAPDGDYTINYS